jgi:flagellar protein FliL
MAKDKGKDKDEDKDEDAVEEGAAAGGGKFGGKKKLILIIVGVLALVGVSVGGTMLAVKLLGKDEPATKVAKKPAADEETDAEAADEGDAKDADAEAEDDTKNPDGTPKVALYFDFEQPFVVNFMDEGQMRYLQITVSVMAMDPKVVEEVKRHAPLIRNNLVMLFSGQTRDAIITREGKEKIRKDAEAEVQKILQAQTGKPGIKALYLTSFVMQ